MFGASKVKYQIFNLFSHISFRKWKIKQPSKASQTLKNPLYWVIARKNGAILHHNWSDRVVIGHNF